MSAQRNSGSLAGPAGVVYCTAACVSFNAAAYVM